MTNNNGQQVKVTILDAIKVSWPIVLAVIVFGGTMWTQFQVLSNEVRHINETVSEVRADVRELQRRP